MKSIKINLRESDIKFHEGSRYIQIILDTEELIGGYKVAQLEYSFFSLLKERIIYLKKESKKSTASNYQCAFRSFKQFRQNEDVCLSEITSAMMKEYENYLKKKNICLNTISFYMRTLRAAYNYGVDEMELLSENRKPFRKVFTGEEKTIKRAVKENVIQELLSLNLTHEPILELARDMFMFSIYMRGMPFVDIAHLRKDNMINNNMSYQRQKTDQRLLVRIMSCAQDIIDKYSMVMRSSEYLFLLLYNPRREKNTTYETALRIHNRRLRTLSERLGLKTPLSSYVARHTWATLAKWSGIPDAIISEAMGHTSCETTKIYLDSFNEDVVDKANKTVVSVLSGRNKLIVDE